MKLKSKILTVVCSALILITNAACGVNDMENKEGGYSSNAEIYFSFENTDKLKDEISKRQYDLKYVFSEAKYKSSLSAANPAGVRGKSALFDGYSTYADTECTRAYDNFTVSVWVAPRAYDTRNDKKLTGIVSSYDESGGFELGLYNYGTWSFKVRTDMGTFQIRSEEEKIDLYKWNYITAVFNGSQRRLYLYKNGVKVAESSSPGGKTVASKEKLRIGGIHDGAVMDEVFTSGMFAGLIDELEIYGSAMSEEQIRDKYDSLVSDVSLSIYEDLWLSREVLADDRYAPQYHMRTSQHWQNETYGFFYYNGYYHAFCQQNVIGPYYTEGQRWGHFVSRDLVYWEELVPALIPEDNGIDNNHVFSGTATLDKDGNPVIFYTGVNYSNKYLNLISAARPADISDDKLENWNKSGKVVVNQNDLSTRDNFRDPFIYKENGEYFMLIGGTDSVTGNGAVYCYKATDGTLNEWQYLSELYSGERSVYPYLGTCYELPNLFKVTNKDKTVTKYMLMLSPIGGTVNGVYYLLGSFDTATGKFIPDREEPYRYDIGPVSQVLCPSGFYDERTDRNLFLTMSRTGMTAQERYDSGWATSTTLIKEIYLNDYGNVCIKPIREYELLNDECLLDISGDYSIEQANTLLSAIKEDMLKITVEMEPAGSEKVGMYVKCDLNGQEYVDISYDLSTEIFYTSAARSSTALRNNGSGGGTVSNISGNPVFTVYVDRSMVEAYLNDSNQITVFGFNQSENSNQIKLNSTGANTKVKRITVHRLNSAHNKTVPAYWGQ